MSSLSDLLRTVRADRHVTENQLAEALGISVNDYTGIEEGIKPLSIELFDRIVEVLKVDPSNVLGMYLQLERDRRKQTA
ncbi:MULTISPECIES: helix-turn-helix domain-containing protein [unclassified Flavobacterium]|uniref:helix-turn-helix domain-containing protein n=1 Tax=unclassified Flavobacterium TaxID=196869 RepID=UPI001F133720|nr:MULTISPECIES: helix-turn-helix transcriptional regulator [unclassified Flavobacterium]UMY67004.1 helix-turn-helix domain-containing protein [Flavobacterium sp. HJ-32-4]